jgi:methylmalonyl-CoA mutase C-terminal domain/subunit
MTLFPRVKVLLEEAGRGEVLLTGGGIIPDPDAAALREAGVGRLIGPGSPTGEAVDYVREWFTRNGRR